MEEVGIPHIPRFTSGYLNGSSWLVHTIDQTTGFRASSESAFLRPFLTRPNLAVYKNTLAEKIVGKVATGVQVTSEGHTFLLAASKEVIVSADLDSLPSDWPEIQYFNLPAYVGDFWNPGVGGPTDGNYATIMATLIAPKCRGNVSISSSSMHDQPLINPNWLTQQVDVELLTAGFKRLRQIFQASVLQENLTIGPEYYPGDKVSTEEQIHHFIQDAFQTMYHAAVTCKMRKPDDEMAVVDSHGLVYGTKRLRVVDASVFPFLPPNLPQGTIYELNFD
ncbi:uncharacterized protein N7529_010630 [Penicillium soppii]|uniref:uncharacterized protein n=1 Tax=Penicillium soppii TaxID=69789 RepID=UPI0025481112|nr:uncharacterized protein N7529_010630 [Penicillium soppii]KAJ5856686.1 hypothetical protein N7529_010630 [Penicillium soppii]